jgi:hypothetical protein
MGNWIAREPWASLRYAHGYCRLAFQAGRLFGGCLPTNLTQTHDGAQVEILADIVRTFRHEEIRQKAVEVGSYIEFLALVRTQGEPGKPLVR